MRANTQRIRKQLKALPAVEKLQMVNTLLSELDKPDPEIDRVWMEESQRRWKAYKSGKVRAIAYSDVMKRFMKK